MARPPGTRRHRAGYHRGSLATMSAAPGAGGSRGAAKCGRMAPAGLAGRPERMVDRSRTGLATVGQLKLLVLAVGVGLVGGLAAVLLRAAAMALPALVWPADPNLAHAVAAAPTAWKLAIPVVGAVIAGLVLWVGARWSGPVRGWDILEAVVLRDGVLHLRPALVKAFSSLVTVASAGPVGREGPMVLVSAAVSSVAARWLKTPVRQRRLLVGCGVAAGIACAYNTPIGAAMFTMEIIVGNFALEVFAPLVFASVVATLLARAVFTGGPVFALPQFALVSVWEAGLYIVLGILGGLTAALFLRALSAATHWFRRSRLPRPVAMAVAGLLLGLVVLRFPDVVGNGREGIADLFQENWSVGLLLALLALRLVVTSATVGAGAAGGVFTPTLFLGAVLGDAFGGVVHHLFPAVTAGPKAYALVGMGCLLAGTTHAPITAVLMLFEMTLDYNIVLPLLLATAAASLAARSVASESVYTEALRRKRGSPAHSGEAAVMRQLTVSDVMRAEQSTAPASTPLPQLLDRFIRERRNHIYVVDEGGHLKGVVSLYEASRALRETADPSRLTAADIADPRFQTTVPGEHLDRTLDRFWVEDCERLPVLDSDFNRRVVGTVSKRDILGVYSLEVLHRRSLLARFESESAQGPKPTYVELPEDHLIDEISPPAEVLGMTFSESRFRDRYGLSVLIVRRRDSGGRVVRLIPEGGTRFEPGDRLIVFGARNRLDALVHRI